MTYIRFKIAKSVDNRKVFARNCQDYIMKLLALSPNNTTGLFILLYLTQEIEAQKSVLKIQAKFKVEDIAVRIKEKDTYIGYLAWAEIYPSRKDKQDFGLNVINELLETYPSKLQAFLCIWQLYF